MLDFKADNQYIELIYVLPGDIPPANRADLLIFSRIDPEGSLHIEGRFRFYVDNKVGHESEDIKQWFSFSTAPGLAFGDEAQQMIIMKDYKERINTLLEVAKVLGLGEVDRIEFYCGGEEAGKKFSELERPWLHKTKLPVNQRS